MGTGGMRKPGKKAPGMNSITRRWIKGNLVLIVLMLVVAEATIVTTTINSYYTGARQVLQGRLEVIAGQVEATSGDSEEEYADALHRLVGQFSEVDKFELMLVNLHGDVVATSSGFVPRNETLADYEAALLAPNGIGEYIGPMGENQKVMAMSYLVDRPAGDIAGLRLVTSLVRVDERVAGVVITVSLVVAIILLAAVLSGLFFVRSIVNPVAKIEAGATRIAAGDFDVRIEPEGADELASLCDTINEMAEELGRTEQLKNEFISSVSHELRTPLTSIKGWAETLGKVQAGDESYRRGVEVIASETDRLYAMVEELLDFSRLQNGGLTLEMEKLDLGAEVADVILMFDQRAAAEQKNLFYDDPNVLYAVWADKNRLRQVFINILDNALKYTPVGGDVTVTVEKTGERAIVAVQDSGPGIDQEDLAYVKTKFYKGRGAVRGSGIGLAVAEEIVQAHGGTLVLRSGKGQGTRVEIRLPLL